MFQRGHINFVDLFFAFGGLVSPRSVGQERSTGGSWFTARCSSSLIVGLAALCLLVESLRLTKSGCRASFVRVAGRLAGMTLTVRYVLAC